MTKTLKSVLMLLGLVVVAHAADDFNSGVIPDQHYLSWGDRSVMIYGDAQTGNEYFRIKTGSSDQVTVNSTGLGIGTTAPQSKLDVEGGAAVGATYSGTTAAPSNGLIVEGVVGIGTSSPGSTAALTIVPANATSTGVIVNLNTSQNADGLQFQINGTTVVVIGAQGHVKHRQYTKLAIDTLTPDFIGAEIQCVNCTLPYVICSATGTAVAQWAVNFSSGNNTRPGCGSAN